MEDVRLTLDSIITMFDIQRALNYVSSRELPVRTTWREAECNFEDLQSPGNM